MFWALIGLPDIEIKWNYKDNFLWLTDQNVQKRHNVTQPKTEHFENFFFKIPPEFAWEMGTLCKISYPDNDDDEEHSHDEHQGC